MLSPFSVTDEVTFVVSTRVDVDCVVVAPVPGSVETLPVVVSLLSSVVVPSLVLLLPSCAVVPSMDPSLPDLVVVPSLPLFVVESMLLVRVSAVEVD